MSFNNHSYPDYGRFIHTSRYARWIEEEGRRETWEETVSRYFSFLEKHLKENNGYTLSIELRKELESAVVNLEVMPSMRSLMTAGPALERDNICGYNCSYVPVDSPRAFDETLYVLMCGTGVGFSVERQFVSKLPIVNEHFEKSETIISVADSKAGWARGLRELLSLLYSGQIPNWDLSRLRPAGARLKTFGGRSSGPEPLDQLFRFTVGLFQKAAGRRLTSIECHDLMCKIGEVVVVGGVRRSALISLSNLTDERMRQAKSGQWWEDNPQRSLANNSVCYTEKPDVEIFMQEFLSLVRSKSGERGIFNRDGAKKFLEKNVPRRDTNHEFGTNPCSEIILRPYQFCNLTEVVVRPKDTYDDLYRKVRIASIIGTLQSTLTNFKYLRKIWKDNTEEERLLGVSLTGVMDHEVLSGNSKGFSMDCNGPVTVSLEVALSDLRELSIETNKQYAKEIGINQSAATNCQKPSGTVSQLVDSASGIHPRYADYYIRTVRGDIKDPLSQFLVDQGVPSEPDVMKPNDTVVFSFPMKSPEVSVKRNDRTAIQQLELWKTYQLYWCEHKPSITVYVREEEWPEVQAWVYKNFDLCSGVSFLPHSDHTYQQAPYQEIDKETYEKLLGQMPMIDWDKLKDYEKEDNTTGSQELACVGNSCDIV